MSLGAVRNIVNKPQLFLSVSSVWRTTHKGRVFVVARLYVPVSDWKLCALLLSFLTVLTHALLCCRLAELSWELISHWMQDTLGRIWEVFFCLHARRESPSAIRYPKKAKWSLCSLRFCDLCSTLHKICCKFVDTCFLTGTADNSVVSLWDETSQKPHGFKYLKPRWLLAASQTEEHTCVPLFMIKMDHISWYWLRKNLIQFRQLRLTTSLCFTVTDKEEGTHVCECLYFVFKDCTKWSAQ